MSHSMASRSRKLIYTFGAVAGFLCATGYVLNAVFTSTSSTAAIGLLFVPVYGVLAAVIGWAVVYIGFSFADAISGRQSWRSGHMLAASVLLAIALLVISALLLFRNALAVARDAQATPEMLMEINEAWLPLGRHDVNVALLKNPATPAAVLTAVVDAGRDHYLVSLAGAHFNTPLASLEKIATGPLAYDRVAGLAGNVHLTPAMAQRLANVSRGNFPGEVEYKLYQSIVLAALARNPATPQDVFDQLAAREAPEYFLSLAIAYSKRATCAQVARVAQSDNEVLRNTAQSQLRQRGC